MSNKKGKKKDDYWESGAAEEDVNLVQSKPAPPTSTGNEDGAKKGKSKAAAKPAEDTADAEPVAEEKPKAGGKKGKKKKDDDYWESGAADEDVALVAGEKSPATLDTNGSAADGKKKGGKKSADEPAPEPEEPKQPAAAKGGKGGKGKKKNKDDYWENEAEADAALLNTKPEPTPAPAPAPVEPPAAKGGKGGKGKGKGGDAAAPASPAPVKEATPAPAADAAPHTETAPAAPAAEDGAKEEAGDEAPTDAAETTGAAKGKKEKGAKAKKAPAPVKVDPKEARRQAIAKAIKEQQAQQKAIEEEQARLAEIERKRREEEARLEEEEQKREDEERERKRIARKKKEEEAKKRKEAEAEEERRRTALSRYVGAPGSLPPGLAAKQQPAPAAGVADGAAPAEGGVPAGEKKKRPIYEKKGAKAGAKKPTDGSAADNNSTAVTPAATATPSLASSSASVQSVDSSTSAPTVTPTPPPVAPTPPVEEEDSWDTKDISADLAKLEGRDKPAPAAAHPAEAPAAASLAPTPAPAVAAATAVAPAAATADKPEKTVEREPAAAEAPAEAKPKKGKADKKDKKDKKPEKGKLSILPSGEPELRSPICCVLGHVDTGKTKLLDKIRRTNYQEGEAGGITQQIGATYFPLDVLKERTKLLADKTAIDIKIPGLLVIDTPGHESFNNLRTRGSSLCDISILVVDIMHGLEPQTIESIGLLKRRKCPFVVALNKVDRLYGWEPHPNSPIQATLKTQNHDVKLEFEQRVQQTITAFAEQGLNASLYYKNPDVRKYVSLVPTSAHTGEGIPDLLNLLVQLTQRMMKSQLTLSDKLVCTVLEVKPTEGHGTTIDVVLSDGEIREGDTIVVCGMNGPIVTTIRALLTPQPLKELRIKGQYQHHKVLRAAQGVKIAAHDLEHAVAGSQLMVVGPNDDVEVLKKNVMGDFAAVMDKYIDKGGKGVFVQASSLGSLEALLEFLKVSSIPVVGVSLGNIHKKDIMRAGVMLERAPEYAVILAFDVHPTPEAKALAEHTGVRIFTADIIYHLFDQFTAYMKNLREDKKKSAGDAVFPVSLQILQVFNKKNPLIIGVKVTEGALRLNTPLCVPSKEFTFIGRVTSIEANKKPLEKAKKGEDVAVRIEGADSNFLIGRNYTESDALYSQITYDTIEALREYYEDELTKEDQELLAKMEHLFGRRLQPIF